MGRGVRAPMQHSMVATPMPSIFLVSSAHLIYAQNGILIKSVGFFQNTCSLPTHRVIIYVLLYKAHL